MEQHWTVEENNNYSPPWVLRYSPKPGGRKNADGSTTHSLSFPALQVTDWVADPETSLGPVAQALNHHDALVEALGEMERACDAIAGARTRQMYLEMIDAGQSEMLLELDKARGAARAALAAVRGQK